MSKEPTSEFELDIAGETLLRLLVQRLASTKPDDPRTFISYKEVHDNLRLHQAGATFGESLKAQGLNSLADWTHETGKPGITGLIIDKTSMMPGEGYFRLFGKSPEDFQWWKSEIVKSKNFDWSPYLQSGKSVDQKSGDSWTIEELRASVVAYLEMQKLDREGVTFSKKSYYDNLAMKYGRSSKSFEYRMQNISYVLSLMGRSWLPGLKPAKNVGANVAAEIEKLVSHIEGTQAQPIVAFEISVRDDMKKSDLPVPSGNRIPEAFAVMVTQYQRDASVKAWVLKEAKGICESCKKPAPFNGSDGLPYLEVHHVRQLAEHGMDTPENSVAICPNCHRALHYGERSKEMIARLYQDVPRLRR